MCPPALERLQKVMAARGLASRREAEKLIVAGLVKVDGKAVTELGVKVDGATARIEVSKAGKGQAAALLAPKRWVALHKPVDVVSTKSTGEGATVMGLLPQDLQGLHPVGRLDKDSSGLILLTDDGVLGYALLDPATHLEKEYEVRTQEAAAESQLEKLRSGMRLDGAALRPAQCRRLGEKLLRITLTEGRNRQIRRMCQKVGLNVASLRRLRIGPLELGGLKAGAWRELKADEITALRKAATQGAEP